MLVCKRCRFIHVRSVTCAGREMEGFSFCPPIVFVYSCYYVVIIESMLACCVCLVTLELFFHSLPFLLPFYSPFNPSLPPSSLPPSPHSVVRKMAHYMSDIIDEEDRGRLHENLLVGPGKLPMEVSSPSIPSYSVPSSSSELCLKVQLGSG